MAGLPQEIVVPGSISNLGSGFDALSVAVELYLRLRITDVLPGSPDRLEFQFNGTALTGENRIEQAFKKAVQRFGNAVPGVRVDVQSDIPMRAGLGSSAAATIAGFRLYEALASPKPADEWLALATEIEGHPDNAAAALLGGLTSCCQFENGSVQAWSRRWPVDVQFVVATPEAQLETAFARKVLPAEISRRDAVFNLQRALLLVSALERRAYGDLREALKDRWHQPTRQNFVPGLEAALELDHPAILGVCLSGSGPSVAALTSNRAEEAKVALGGIYERLGLPYTIRTLAAHQPGSAGHA